MDIRINQAFDEILAAYPKSEFEALTENLKTNLSKEKSLSDGGDFPLGLRPALLPKALYLTIREASFYLTNAVRKAAKALIKEGLLANELFLTDPERRLVDVDPLYSGVFTTASWSVLVEKGKPVFTEFTPDVASEIALNDALARVYMDWRPMAKMLALYDVDYYPAAMRLFQEVLNLYEGYKQNKLITATEKKPVILIADWLEDRGATDAERLAAYGKAQGYDVPIADPRALGVCGNGLYSGGQPIDAVWRIFPARDMLLRKNDCEDLLEAYNEHKVCMAESVRAIYGEKRAILSVLADERFERIFSKYEREAIQTFIPWTRRFEETFSRYKGKKVDLPEFVLENKDKLILKSNDRYKENGTYKGERMTDSEWSRTLETALKDECTCWIVQERVKSVSELFPVLHNGDLGFEGYEIQILPYVIGDMADSFAVRLTKASNGNKDEKINHLPAVIVSGKQVALQKQLSSN